MRTIIIEDEQQAISALKADIAKHCPELSVIGTAGTVQDGIALMASAQPELVFLDIQLTDGLGFDILEACKGQKVQVIFTTAYSQYAIKAIRFSALDYLLKPIDATELKEAVARAQSQKSADLGMQIENFLRNQALPQQNRRIALHTSQGIHLYELQSIVRCNAEGNYTCVHFTNGKKLLVARPLKEFEELLPVASGGTGFERIHHSHIINLDHLVSYINRDGGYVLLSDQTTLPVSSRKKAQLLTALEGFRNL
ncbi:MULTISPECIES: LytTR family DNA-binding domain-containing protein [unclassified Flavobacterium]|uniref:LytR/AlgR family response regulator transcription factor n=1 Tax=unclassified Flavobacterium TaxID=196869 RepID=UPI001F145FEB|nr:MULTISPECIES: LytTR family DNA-binding domain-containing protein [unclassified Flavobacterium]UMY67054.1 LytTR family DNA-binding domain-containing protein [Flavobacterium sp. HJ-32-4]